MPNRLVRAMWVVAALFLVMGSRASLAQEEIFVTNQPSNSVTVYTRTGSGNLAPLRTLVGAATGLASPRGLAVDIVNNELIVVNTLSLSESVTVYPRTANGNVAPLRTISGPLTGLSDSRGLSVDVVNNELAVVNRIGASVRVFARTAIGNVAPLRTITGLATGLSNPTDLAIDLVNNELVVANNGGSLTVYARTANGNAAPLRTISGALTGFNNGPIGVAVDTVNNELAVTNPSFGPSFLPSILVFGRTANGNVAPLRAIVGPATGLVFNPNGVAVDTANNELVMVNGGNNSVRVYGRTANGDVAPLRTISGAATLLNNPQFLVIAPAIGPVTPTPTATPTVTPTPTATPTVTLTPPGPTSTPTITQTPGGPTVTPTPTTVPGTLTITTTSPLPSGVVGTPYSQTLMASGGTPPYTWSILTGSLPGGLSLTPSTGVISGTPTAAGTFSFTAQVTDADEAGATASRAFTLTIAPQAVVEVPTLNFWGLLALTLLLAGIGAFALRRMSP